MQVGLVTCSEMQLVSARGMEGWVRGLEGWAQVGLVQGLEGSALGEGCAVG